MSENIANENDLRSRQVSHSPNPSDTVEKKNLIIYKSTLEDIEPDRVLYLAVRSRTYQEIFEETIGATLLRKRLLKLIVFDPAEETIVQWIP